MLKLGAINYINALPFFASFQLREVQADIDLIYDYPANLNYKLARGEIDFSFISSVEYLQNRENYRKNRKSSQPLRSYKGCNRAVL